MNENKHDHAKGPGEDPREDDLLMSLWKVDAMAFNPAPVSSKTKKTLQEMLRRHGVTHMPAIDALEVYDAPDDVSAEAPAGNTPAPGRLALFELLGAMRDRVAVAVSGVAEFLEAMSRPLPMVTGSAMRRTAEPGEALRDLRPTELQPAHDWHIEGITVPPNKPGALYMYLRTHRPGVGPVHVAVLGWSAATVTRLRGSVPAQDWVPAPEDVICLWEGDLDGSQQQHRLSIDLPSGYVLASGFEARNTVLVNDGAGAWIASLTLAAVKRPG